MTKKQKTWAFVIAAVLLLGLIGAVTHHTATRTSSPNDQALTPYTTVPVSPACISAMQAAAAGGIHVNDADPTLVRCGSKDEWLTGVQGFVGPGEHEVVSTDILANPDPFVVLQGLCDDYRSAHGGANAPACNGVPPVA